MISNDYSLNGCLRISVSRSYKTSNSLNEDKSDSEKVIRSVNSRVPQVDNDRGVQH